MLASIAPSPTIEQFFERYAAGVQAFDAEVVTGAFAGTYVRATPDGSIVAYNDDAFRAAFPPWRERFLALGFRSAAIREITTTPLDDHFTVARVSWRMRFEPASGPVDVDFDESYVLHERDDAAAPTIVLAISHRDEAETLRAAGLLR